jgi:hypothetical protein
MLVGLALAWGSASASETRSQSTITADASFVASLAVSPLEGAIPLLPTNCPRLCSMEQGKSCPGPATETCYDTILKVCSTCHCDGNLKWSCGIGA